VSTYDGFVLVSFGGPESTEDVLPFLRKVTAGRGIPEERVNAVAEHYFAAGGASPVNGRCRELLGALRRELSDLPLRLYWGNRNWHPLLEDTVSQMRDDGVRRALALVTSAYGGYSSCRQYLDDIAAARAKVGPGAPEIDKLRLYYNHPGWVGPWARSLLSALERARPALGNNGLGSGGLGSGGLGSGGTGTPAQADTAQVLFSAHSIPVSMARTSPYARQVGETARLVATMTGTTWWQLVWQSRSGNPATPWLGPDVCEVIEASTAPAMVVVPIGFACDNMEVVHDLDVEAAAAAKKAGAHFERAATVSTSPGFVSMVRQLVQERLGLSTERLALGTEGAWADACPAGHCPTARLATG
jgi:ferrochelatase